jgi:nucleotide-binding universal stress UspA family protein
MVSPPRREQACRSLADETRVKGHDLRTSDPGRRRQGVVKVELSRGGTVFSSIVVPLDLTTAGDRALPVARSLAQLGGLPIELLTVVPGRAGRGCDRWDLEERVRSFALGPHTSFVLEREDAGAAIAEHVRCRDGALLVLATTAKAAIDEDYAGGVSECVLAEACQPVLLVGPRVEIAPPLSVPALVVGVDGSGLASVAVPVVLSWWRSFGGVTPTFVEVIPYVPTIAAQVGRALEATHVRAYVAQVAQDGVEAVGEVLYGADAATTLADYVAHLHDSVLVVTAERWAGAETHWHGTSRKLAFRSTAPVLVVPADLR